MTPMLRVEVVATDIGQRQRLLSCPADIPLPAALCGHLLTEPLNPALAGLTLGEVDAQVRLLEDVPAGTPLYSAGSQASPGDLAGPGQATGSATGPDAAAPSASAAELPAGDSAAGQPAVAITAETAAGRWPAEISDPAAVERAYSPDIDLVASFLRRRLSVLVICDKLVVEFLAPLIAERSRATGVRLDPPPAEQDSGNRGMSRSHRQRQLEQLRDLLRDLKDEQFLVIPHLDLLSSGTEGQLSAETRELIELLYNHSSRLILAFIDPSLGIPEVLADRFGVRVSISGSPRVVQDPATKEELTLGEALVTRAEAELFEGFNAAEFHKHVAGLNPIRLRQAVRYAYAEHQGTEHPSDAHLRRAIRAFKAQMSSTFEVPDVTFDDIGGYQEVKDAIADALQIMSGLHNIPAARQRLQGDLMPRGFIFYGPPGTGKTLFAKAIANQLNATIMVVSGPEVTDKYVGEGERKIRELFASARRNAPSVIVFDEFDAIAGRRTDRDDGGSRAGNAMVAQLLTELDGFREDVPFLVIGTTNQLRLIDPAMRRPSRFRAIQIDLPNVEARRSIIRVHAKRFGIDISQELVELIADATEHRSGDDLQSIFREAFVGLHLHELSADAERLGELVGKLNREAREQREDTL